MGKKKKSQGQPEPPSHELSEAYLSTVATTAPPCATVDEWKAAGNAAYAADDIRKALALFSLGLRQFPDAVALYSNRSQCYFRLNAMAESLADADAALRVDPGFKRAHMRRANIFQSQGRDEDVAAVCREVLRIDPEDAWAPTMLKQLESKVDDEQRARQARADEYGRGEPAITDPKVLAMAGLTVAGLVRQDLPPAVDPEDDDGPPPLDVDDVTVQHVPTVAIEAELPLAECNLKGIGHGQLQRWLALLRKQINCTCNCKTPGESHFDHFKRWYVVEQNSRKKRLEFLSSCVPVMPDMRGQIVDNSNGGADVAILAHLVPEFSRELATKKCAGELVSLYEKVTVLDFDILVTFSSKYVATIASLAKEKSPSAQWIRANFPPKPSEDNPDVLSYTNVLTEERYWIDKNTFDDRTDRKKKPLFDMLDNFLLLPSGWAEAVNLRNGIMLKVLCAWMGAFIDNQYPQCATNEELVKTSTLDAQASPNGPPTA